VQVPEGTRRAQKMRKVGGIACVAGSRGMSGVSQGENAQTRQTYSLGACIANLNFFKHVAGFREEEGGRLRSRSYTKKRQVMAARIGQGFPVGGGCIGQGIRPNHSMRFWGG